MGWEAHPYDPSLAAIWDDLVRSARARHFLFERDYMDYHADRFADGSLILLYDGRPVAVLPASRHDEELISHGGLTFGALLSDERMTTGRAVDALTAVVRRLREQGVRRWTYKPVPHIYHLTPAEEDLYALISLGARIDRREASAAVRCADPTRYSSERARAVRRARREELELGRCEDFEEFITLLADTLGVQHGVSPVHTPGEMSLLAARFPDAIKLYAARTGDGEMVAGTIIYETPTVAHAQYIAASTEGRRVRAQDGLFDHLLADVYSTKRWFDFGISNERDGSLNNGLIRNKEGFGARCVVHDRYVLELR